MRNTSGWPLDVYHCVCKYVYASEHVYVCSMCRIHASVCVCACACVRARGGSGASSRLPEICVTMYICTWMCELTVYV